MDPAAVHDQLTGRAARGAEAVAAMSLDDRLVAASSSAATLAAVAAEVVDSAVAEVGQPLRFARREVDSALLLAAALPDLADAIRPRPVPAVWGETMLEYRPYGVVLGWHAANSPVWVPTLVVLSALVAGNAVISRPSRRAARTTGAVLDALEGPWPPDAIVRCDLSGPEAEPLVWHPGVHAVVTHGSSETCKRQLSALGAAYGEGAILRPYVPEGSGNDAMLVLPGADLPRAAEAVALAAFANGGQLCMSAKRIIVERTVWDRFQPLLIDAASDLVTGAPHEEATDVAPLPPGRAQDEARRRLAEARAAGGRMIVGADERASALAPTIVLLPRDRLDVALWTEETFAPVRGLAIARDEADAVALANDSRFALGAAVFGGRPGVEAGLRAARVVVGESALYQDPHLVVGGVGDSGIAGARPKLEQLVWARRTHRGA